MPTPLFIKIHELIQSLAGLAQRLYTDGHTTRHHKAAFPSKEKWSVQERKCVLQWRTHFASVNCYFVYLTNVRFVKCAYQKTFHMNVVDINVEYFSILSSKWDLWDRHIICLVPLHQLLNASTDFDETIYTCSVPSGHLSGVYPVPLFWNLWPELIFKLHFKATWQTQQRCYFLLSPSTDYYEAWHGYILISDHL
jgi:hypothetical protein